MTDDNNSRYRSSDPFSSAPAGQGASDPLAELARLIGKNDPFAELGRSSAPPSHRPNASHAATSPRDTYREPRFDDPPPPADHYDSQARHESAFPQVPFPPQSGGWDATAQPAPTYDPFAPHAQQAPLSADTHYEEHPYAAGSHASGQPQPVVDNYQPEYDPHQLDAHSSYDNENAARPGAPLVASLGDVPGFGPPPFHPAESGAAQPSEDQFYDDAPPRRRKGLVTVAAVMVLAVVGTAAAFGYRSYRSGTGSLAALVPIIKAPSEPTKVAPPAPQPSADASKISYDRFGDRGQNEKVVSREEQPVDQREIVRSSSVPRTVLPGAPTPSSSNASNNPPGAAPQSANPPSVLGEPKRIRTVPIRPDQADASASASSTAAKQIASLPAPPPQAAPAPQPVQQAAPLPPPPLETAPAAQRAAAPPQAPVERAPRAQRNAQQVPAGNAPMSLAPDANNSPAPVASTPAPRPSAPMQVASAPSNGGTGRYHVQVASQRSEADAQAAYRSVQGKYSTVLGGQQHVIRRVELGEKGTYYRAMVGPFATREQAVQLCSSLKSAGGDCVVQSN